MRLSLLTWKNLFSAALCDAINESAKRGKKKWPFYQQEMSPSLSLSAPKTYISFIVVIVHLLEASGHISQHALLSISAQIYTLALLPHRRSSSSSSTSFLKMKQSQRCYWMLTDSLFSSPACNENGK